MSQSPPPRPARLVREAAPFVLLLCACGAAVTEGPAPPPSPPVAASASSPPPAPAASESFDDLAARAQTLAPGMHEASRRSGALDAIELWRAEQGDACLRVAFASTVPVTAKLVLQTGEVLAATAEPAVEGALGDRGPVCVRKGDVVKGLAEGPAAHVRWIVWEAP